MRANRWLVRRIRDDVLVQVRCPIRLSGSEPEPDIALVPARIAVTSLTYDRRTKISLYGREGVIEAWLADLDARTIFAYREPGPDGYGQVQHYAHDAVITPIALPHLAVPVSAIVGESVSGESPAGLEI